jgi:hypothetical protein
MSVDPGVVTDSDRRVMNAPGGAVNAKAFVRFVHRIVDGRWIEQGSMRNAH